MKRIASLLMAALFFAASISAAVWKSPLSFDSYQWNFGSINPSEGTVCHTFTFTNMSKEAVVIFGDIPSCECIRAFYDNDAVEPGESADVMIAYSPRKDRGKSYRRV